MLIRGLSIITNYPDNNRIIWSDILLVVFDIRSSSSLNITGVAGQTKVSLNIWQQQVVLHLLLYLISLVI